MGELSFTFTLDQDGEEVPSIKCPKCSKKECELIGTDTDLHKCNNCGNEFVPEIYQVLDTAEDYVVRGWKNFEGGYYKRAIKDSTAALKLDPEERKAYLIRGRSHSERKEWEEAEKDFSEAVNIYPEYDVAFFNRGQARLHLNMFDDAIADLTASIGFDPECADTYEFRAIGYFNKDDYLNAIRDFSEAISRKPNNASALYQRGYSFSLIGESDKALDDFTEVIKINPKKLDTYYRKAEIFEKQNKYQDAIEDYKNFLRAGGNKTTVADEVVEKINTLQHQIDPNLGTYTFDPDEEVSIWEDVTLEQDTKEWRSIDRGTKLLEKGDLDGAYKEFSLFIEHVPESIPAYIYRGCASYQRGNLDEVIKDLTGAIEYGAEIYEEKGMFSSETDPRYKNIYLLRGSIYTLMGKHEEALADFVQQILTKLDNSYRSMLGFSTAELNAPDVAADVFLRLLDVKPVDADSNFVNGLFALLHDERDEALKFINKAIKKDSKNPGYYWCRGMCQEETKDAIEDFSKALSIKGDLPEYHFVIGFKRMMAREVAKGQEDFLEAIRLDPNNYEYHEKLGVFLAKYANYEAAIEHSSKAIALNLEDIDAYYCRGICHEWNNDMQAALADFRMVIELEGKPGFVKIPVVKSKIEEITKSEENNKALRSKKNKKFKSLSTAKEYIQRGEISLHASDWDNAYLDFEEAIRMEPDNSDAYKNRGMTSYKMGDTKSAIKDYSQAIKLEPNNSNLLIKRGIIRAESKDMDNALLDFTEAIRIDPKNHLAFHMRANAYAASWDTDSAEADYEEAIRLNPKDADVYFSRAKMWKLPIFMGADDSALDDCNEAIRLNPEKADFYLFRGKLKVNMGDKDGAEQDIRKVLELDPKNEQLTELIQEASGVKKKKIIVDENNPMPMLAALLGGSNQEVEQEDEDENEEEGVEVYRMRGMQNFLANDYEATIENFTKVIELEPNNHENFKIRGLAKYRCKQVKESIEDFTHAIELNPEDEALYVLRVVARSDNDDIDGALEDIASAIQYGDDGSKTYELKSGLLLRRASRNAQENKVDESIADVTEAIKLGNTIGFAYFIRGLCFATKEGRPAISDLQTYLEISGEEVEDREKYIGWIEDFKKDIDPSTLSDSYIESFTDPKKLEIVKLHIERGVQDYTNKDMAKALEEFQIAINIDPTNAQPFMFSALIYLTNQDWEKAIFTLTELIRVNPDLADAYFNRGTSLFQTGHQEEAIKDFEAAIVRKPDYPDAYKSLGGIYLTQEKYDLAIENLTKAITLNPEITSAYIYRANAKAGKDDVKGALTDFEKYVDLGGSPEGPDTEQVKEQIRKLKKENGE